MKCCFGMSVRNMRRFRWMIALTSSAIFREFASMDCCPGTGCCCGIAAVNLTGPGWFCIRTRPRYHFPPAIINEKRSGMIMFMMIYCLYRLLMCRAFFLDYKGGTMSTCTRTESKRRVSCVPALIL